MQLRKMSVVLMAVLILGGGYANAQDPFQDPFGFGQQLKEVSDEEFVFQVCNKIKAEFYDSDRVIYGDLLNKALGGVAVLLREKNVDWQPAQIPLNAKVADARKSFTKQLGDAKKIAEGIDGLSNDDLVFAAAHAAPNAVGDSHTRFLSPDAMQRLKDSQIGGGSQTGIGTTLVKLEDGFFYFDCVFKNSPADQSGLKKLDRLISVNGESVENMASDLTEVLLAIKAKAKVSLVVERKGERKTIEITSSSMKVPLVEFEKLRRDDKDFLYIRVYNFLDPIGMDFLKNIGKEVLPNQMDLFKIMQDPNFKNLKGLVAEKPDGIILDLRGNPGGAITFLYIVMCSFLDGGQPVTVLHGNPFRQPWDQLPDNKMTMSTPPDEFMQTVKLITFGKLPMTDVPMAVLIDKRSGSASEAAAAAFKELGRAKLIGQTTAGKCGAGKIFPLTRNAAMMVTVADIRTPKKNEPIEGVGISPDIKVVMNKESISAGKDNQLEKAFEVLSK